MLSPSINATIKLPSPEKQPFIITISSELLLLIILVQLFSKPQQMQAPNTNKDPSLNTNALLPSKLSMALATVTKPIAAHSFLEMTSLKITNAIKEVATISKLLSNETFAAFVLLIPNIKRIGAIISSTTIPIVYGNSFFVKGSSFCRFPITLLTNRYIEIPIPAPK